MPEAASAPDSISALEGGFAEAPWSTGHVSSKGVKERGMEEVMREVSRVEDGRGVEGIAGWLAGRVDGGGDGGCSEGGLDQM